MPPRKKKAKVSDVVLEDLPIEVDLKKIDEADRDRWVKWIVKIMKDGEATLADKYHKEQAKNEDGPMHRFIHKMADETGDFNCKRGFRTCFINAAATYLTEELIKNAGFMITLQSAISALFPDSKKDAFSTINGTCLGLGTIIGNLGGGLRLRRKE